MSVQDVQMLFMFIGGLGLFLFGMNTMAEGLQKSAGNKTKKLMGVLTNNRFLAIVVGALITALIQSSSATTVMVVGFVNAGVLSLVQAVGVIMGANVGTTITAWIVSMNEWGSFLKPDFFAPLLVGIGAFLLIFSKGEKKREVGSILIGFGVLFIGLSFMSDAIKPYRSSPVFEKAFVLFGNNPLLGVLAGAVVTAVIQSSSASVSILQTLALNGVVNWNSAVFITLGQNIGTCVTALLSSAGASKNAKRAAVIHLLFNTIGAVVFGVIMYVLFSANKAWASASINSVQISIFHTVFNVANTLLLFPFANQLVKISTRILREGEEETTLSHASLAEEARNRLNQRFLETPNFAVEVVSREIVTMGDLTLDNSRLAAKALLENNQKFIQQVLDREKEINGLQKVLTHYLVRVNNSALNEKQYLKIKNLLYTINDMERIGDHAENLVELASEKMKENLEFSKEAVDNLKIMVENVLKAVQHSLEARNLMDLSIAEKVNQYEETVDAMEARLREEHVYRLSRNQCSAESGVLYVDALSNLERMADHAHNIAGYVIEEIKK